MGKKMVKIATDTLIYCQMSHITITSLTTIIALKCNKIISETKLILLLT